MIKGQIYDERGVRGMLGRVDMRPLVALGVLKKQSEGQYLAIRSYDGVDRVIFALREYVQVGGVFTFRGLQKEYGLTYPSIQKTVDMLLARGIIRVWDRVFCKGAPHDIYKVVKGLDKFVGDYARKTYSPLPPFDPKKRRRWFDI